MSMSHSPLPVHELLAAIIAFSDDAIVSKDLNGVVTSWNPAAERIFGYTAEEMIGRPIALLVPPERPDEEPEILSRIVRGERVDHFQTERIRKDGVRINVSVTISPVRDPTGKIVGASKIARDISEHMRLQAQLAQHSHQIQAYSEQIHAQNEELQIQNEELLAQNEQLAAADRQKNQFLAMLAHELRNPLGPVLYATHLLRARLAADAESGRYAGVIDRQVRHMARLLDDLLEVSRIVHGTVHLRQETLDLGLLLYSVAHDLRDYVEERRHEVSISVPPEPLPVHGDPLRLEQVITNLVNNAVKFTPPGGSIHLSAAAEGDEAVIRVRDSGTGIEPELLTKVFDLFTQADQGLERSQGGLGVGLTMVRSLVGLHGGSVEAHSQGSGQGAEFVVRLPLAGGPRRSPTGEQGPEPSPTACRVLVVDDMRDAADTLAEVLESWGHSACVAYDGRDAVSKAADFRPQVVILDIGMPGMDGYQVAQRLRQADQSVVLIAMTGYGQDADCRRAQEAGFDRHLTKPVDPQTLRGVLAGKLG